jgi:hypothetical protein
MGSMRPPDPSPEPTQVGDVPRAVSEAIDSLARLRSRSTTSLLAAPAPADGAPTSSDARNGRLAEDAARAALRQAVERYARDLRREGVPPERMIVAVKGVVKRATAAPQSLPDAEHLVPDLVQWSIAAYFSAD